MSGTPSSARYTHQLALTAIVFRNAGWTETEIQKRLVGAAAVYTQCGVLFSHATIVFVEPFEGQESLASQGNVPGSQVYRIAQATPPCAGKPWLYFVGGNNDPDGAGAFSEPEYSVGRHSPLLDTVWITAETQVEWGANRPEGYSVESHELAHVLVNSGHLFDYRPNLLSSQGYLRVPVLTADQCAAIRKHRLVQKISVP